jgi:citrate lyase subunit beta/citryl-CoA lyase
LEKAPSVDADAFLLDLEDAVAPSEKANARAQVIEAILSLDFDRRPVAVRVNGWASPWALDDVTEVVGGCRGRLGSVMLPKAAGPGEVVALSALLDEVERSAGIEPGSTGIDVVIESAGGLSRVEDTVLASPRVESLAVGLGDLAATLGMPVLVAGAPSETYPGDIYHYALFRILVAGRAAGVTTSDSPYLRLGDLDGLSTIASRSRALGFDGKWAIHPDQVPVLNAIFSPTPDEIARATAVIDALDRAIADEGRGAVRHSDEMIDEATRKMAASVLARAGHRRATKRTR